MSTICHEGYSRVIERGTYKAFAKKYKIKLSLRDNKLDSIKRSYAIMKWLISNEGWMDGTKECRE